MVGPHDEALSVDVEDPELLVDEPRDHRRVMASGRWLRRPTGVAAMGLIIALAACGSVAPLPTPTPSVAAEQQAEADTVVEALFERMTDPEVTYRAHSEVIYGEPDENDQAPGRIWTDYDVAADDYGGWLRIRGLALPDGAGCDCNAYVVDGTTHVIKDFLDPVVVADTPPSVRHPNPFLALEPGDVQFLGMTEGGDFEYAVVPWVGGDPFGEWADVGLLPHEPLAPISIDSHETRLVVNREGVPSSLTSTWAFTTEAGVQGDGSLVTEFDSFGLYLDIQVPSADRFPIGWSHDIGVGVDETHTVVREAFAEVRPSLGPSADLEITFPVPEQPVILGIEGAIAFVRAHGADGEVILDRIVSFEGDELELPVGDLTVVAYYRTCDGNCSLLGHATDFCQVDIDVAEGERYLLEVAVTHEPSQAECRITPTP